MTQGRTLRKGRDARGVPVCLGTARPSCAAFFHSGLCMLYHAVSGLSRGRRKGSAKIPVISRAVPYQLSRNHLTARAMDRAG